MLISYDILLTNIYKIYQSLNIQKITTINNIFISFRCSVCETYFRKLFEDSGNVKPHVIIVLSFKHFSESNATNNKFAKRDPVGEQFTYSFSFLLFKVNRFRFQWGKKDIDLFSSLDPVPDKPLDSPSHSNRQCYVEELLQSIIIFIGIIIIKKDREVRRNLNLQKLSSNKRN